MTLAPRFAPEERAEKLNEALNGIGSWLLNTVRAEPGWNEMVLDIKPLTDAVFVRIIESRDEQDYVGSVGPLKADSAVLKDIEKLQHAAYDEREGTWFTATVVVAAKNWPNPQYQIGAAYNRQEEPEDWDGEGRMTARELRAHLELFPREDHQLPDWAHQRLAGRALRAESQEENHTSEVPNLYLVAALEKIVPGQRTDQGVVNVLRASLGGDLLLDISDSDIVPEGEMPVGPQSSLQYQVRQMGENLHALCVYSSSEHILAQRQGASEPATIVRENAVKVYMDFMQNDSLQLIVVDPGSKHETVFEKGQVGWVLSTPFNEVAKQALMAGNMPQLLGALASPSAFLLVGSRPGEKNPLFVPSASAGAEPEILLAFTSAAEVASVDVSLQAKAAPALEVLKLADTLDATGLRINAANPSATLPIGQVRELIALIEESQSSSGLN